MYYIVFVIGLLLSLRFKTNRKAFNVYFVMLLTLAVFRYGVGPDYFSYAYRYVRIDPSFQTLTNLENVQEMLFYLVGFVFRVLGLNYEVYAICITIVNMIFIYKTCSRYSTYPVMSLFVYYSFFCFVWTFSVYRQGLALTIGVYYLLKCLEESKFRKIIIVSIILSFIHTSALLLIILYLLARIDYSKRALIIISVVSGAISFLPIGKIVASFSSIGIIDRMMPYISNEYSISGLLDFKSISRIAFLVIGLFFYNALRKKDYINNVIVKLYILSLLLYFVLKFSELTASRTSIYGFYLLILILPNIYSLYEEKVDKVVYVLLFVFLSSIYFVKELSTMKNLSGMKYEGTRVPYTSIIRKDDVDFDNIYTRVLKDEGNY